MAKQNQGTKEGKSVFTAEWTGVDAMRYGVTRAQVFRDVLKEHRSRWRQRGYTVR